MPKEEYGPFLQRTVVVNFCLSGSSLKNELSGLALFHTLPNFFRAGVAL